MTIASTFPNGLRPKQVSGGLTLMTKRRHCLADQPGAGKTAQILLGLELDGAFRKRPAGERVYATLIMTMTLACQSTWAPELKKRVLSQYDVVLADLTDTQGKKTMPSIAARDDRLARAWMDANERGVPLIVLMNFESLRLQKGVEPKMPTLFSIWFDAVVIDESHLVLPTTADSPNDPKMTQFWRGLMRLNITDDAVRWPVSGTLDRGTLDGRYGTYKFMFPRWYTDYWRWAKSTFVVTTIEVGMDPRTGRARRIPQIGALRDPNGWIAFEQEHVTRRTKAEMLDGLLPKLWADDGGVDLAMTPAQRAAYFDFQADMEAKREDLIADGELNAASAIKLQWNLRARQLATCTWTFEESVDDKGVTHTKGTPVVAGPAHSNKLAWMIEWLDTRGYLPEGWDPTLGKVVIVSFFTEVLHWLQKELAAVGVRSDVLAGDTSAPEKAAREAAFQNGDSRVILLSGYLGVSINLDAADDLIFVDSIHDPDRMEQIEDRIHRASRMHVCTYWRLSSLDTVDVAILGIVDSRYRETRAIYDGARGVEFARRMLTA